MPDSPLALLHSHALRLYDGRNKEVQYHTVKMVVIKLESTVSQLLRYQFEGNFIPSSIWIFTDRLKSCGIVTVLVVVDRIGVIVLRRMPFEDHPAWLSAS